MDTSSFDVLRFLEGLVSDSRELARFRKDREQYLADRNCPPEARQALLILPLKQEISTVIDLKSALSFVGAAPSAAAPIINLSGQEVVLTTSERVFLAEGTEGAGATCLLLQDSYFTYDDQTQQLAFCLNIAYTYPYSPNTYVAVFNIRHNASGQEPGNLAIGAVQMVIHDYALLKQFHPTTVVLEPGSVFDPSTGTLFLSLAS